MDFTTDYRLENYILDTTWDSLPESVQNRARGCALDLIGALTLGSQGKQFRCGISLAEAYVASGDIPIVGSDKTFNLLGGAIAMGHSANSFDIDDGHNMIKGHPGASFAAGLFTAAAKENISFEEFLTTLVIGYDVAVRTGLAIQEDYGFLHSTGTYGAVATAAVMGRILGFTKEQMNNALSLADFHAPLTPVMRSVEYPSMCKDGVPFGSLTGAMSVLETLAGSTGKTYTLESGDERYLLDDLGQNYEIMNLYFKPYTCCRWAHQPIRAIIDIMGQESFGHEDVEKVLVHTFDSAARLSKKRPVDTEEAQYNIAWPVASAIVHGEVGYLQMCDAAVGNESVLAMMDRLGFVVDPALDCQFPEKRLAWVEIALKDGRVFKSKVYAADGEATDNIGNEWLAAKFNRITNPVMGEKSQAIVDLVLNGGLSMPIRDIIAAVNEAVLS